MAGTRGTKSRGPKPVSPEEERERMLADATGAVDRIMRLAESAEAIYLAAAAHDLQEETARYSTSTNP